MKPYQPDRDADCELPDALPLRGGPLDGLVIDTRREREKISSGRPFSIGWGVRSEFGVLVACICTCPPRRFANYCYRDGKIVFVR